MSPAPPTAPTHFYKALLHLYPPRFRAEFSDEMICDFDDATADAWDAGRWPAVLAFWSVLAADFARTLVVQWLRTGWPLLAGISAAWSLSWCVLIAQQLAPPARLGLPPSPLHSEHEMVLMILVCAVFVVLVAVTIVSTAWFWGVVVRRRRRA